MLLQMMLFFFQVTWQRALAPQSTHLRVCLEHVVGGHVTKIPRLGTLSSRDTHYLNYYLSY